MASKDLLHRFIFENRPVRGEFIHLNDSFQTIVNQHAYPAPVRQLLGEALCIAGLLSAIIKFEGRLTLQFRGKGALKLLLAQCDNQFNMRGLVKWEGELSYDQLIDALEEGVLVVMLDPGPGKNRYQGIVSFRGRSLAESIEGYFTDSEQLPTKIWLAVDDKQAAGLLLQIVPGVKKEETQFSENPETDWQYVNQLTSKLHNTDMLDLDYEALLLNLYPGEQLRLFTASPVKFNCSCSRARSEDAIRLLGQEEAEAELSTHQIITVTCDFCNQEYIFDRGDVAAIFAEKGTPPPTDIHLH